MLREPHICDLKNSTMNRITHLVLILLATFVGYSSYAQYDDLYYDPDDFYAQEDYTATTYTEEYNNSNDAYDSESYDYDDYSYYTRKIRRFDRPSNSIDYYSSVFDPFYSPMSVSVTVGNSWRYNPWYTPGSRFYYYNYPVTYYTPYAYGPVYRPPYYRNQYSRYNDWFYGGNSWAGSGFNGYGGGYARPGYGYAGCPPGFYGATRNTSNGYGYSRNSNDRSRYYGTRSTTSTNNPRSNNRRYNNGVKSVDRNNRTYTGSRSTTRGGRVYDSSKGTYDSNRGRSQTRPSTRDYTPSSTTRGRTQTRPSTIRNNSSFNSTRSNSSSGRSYSPSSRSSSRSSSMSSGSSSRSSSSSGRSGRRN